MQLNPTIYMEGIQYNISRIM